MGNDYVLRKAKELRALLRIGYVSKFDFILSNFSQIEKPIHPEQKVEVSESSN